MGAMRLVQALRVLLGVAALHALGCGPPPESTDDGRPCAMLRRRVCGERDECRGRGDSGDGCLRCKSGLCDYVLSLERDHLEANCAVEYRARPEYPLCEAPFGMPNVPPPPFLYPVQCEAECSLVPYPPAPPLPGAE